MALKLKIYNNQPNAPKPNRPLMPGACAVIINQNRGILLHKRADGKVWSLPGGQMNLGESISQCLLRELREELNISVQIIRLIGIYTSPKVIFEFPNGDVFQSFVVAFLCKAKDDKIKINKESTSFKWTRLGELKKLKTLPFVKEIIADALSAKPAAFD
ncbi:MAG: NUDIX hydrolase [Candidatus Levybacteria bacterium CG10_big_fil_rev_8_21_14_0_10_35_13]|nr:MAG: NUDIX hydrolase [Candidatus Levybacteria bacterium CG10_big_fil_rev_8_21_14_0_10_35_13]